MTGAVMGVRCAALGAKLKPVLGRKPLAALGAAARQDLAAPGGGHAGAEAMPALPYKTARLIGPLGAHDWPRASFGGWKRGAALPHKARGRQGEPPKRRPTASSFDPGGSTALLFVYGTMEERLHA